MADDIFILSPAGEQVGPVKASVQGNKVFVPDENLVIEEGGTILRPLPNGRAESYRILEARLYQSATGRLSHYEVLVPAPGGTTINISHSQGFQVGDGNVLNIIASLETLGKAIDSADVPEEQKRDAKDKLKALLSHPLTTSILGSAASTMLGKI